MRRALLLFLLAAPLAIRAQVPTLIPGARLRVEAPIQIEGTLMAQTPDSLTIASVGAMRTVVASSAVSRIKVSEGKSHTTGAIKGAKIGAVVGGSAGLLLGALLGGNFAEIMRLAGLEAVGGAVWGIGIGAVVGAEKWTTVYRSPTRVTFGRASSGGPTVGLAFRF